jgi:hypothetical protein
MGAEQKYRWKSGAQLTNLSLMAVAGERYGTLCKYKVMP